MQKQINELRAQLTKEKAKREKLLDLYTDNLITKEEFRERNDSANVLISQLEEESRALELKSQQSSDYAAELEKIETCFKELYRPGHIMSKEEVDEMAGAMIDRIDVVPVNSTEMKLEIKLKTSLAWRIFFACGICVSRRLSMLRQRIWSYATSISAALVGGHSRSRSCVMLSISSSPKL